MRVVNAPGKKAMGAAAEKTAMTATRPDARLLLGQKLPQLARRQTLFSPSRTSGDGAMPALAGAAESRSAVAWGGKRMLGYMSETTTDLQDKHF